MRRCESRAASLTLPRIAQPEAYSRSREAPGPRTWSLLAAVGQPSFVLRARGSAALARMAHALGYGSSASLAAGCASCRAVGTRTVGREESRTESKRVEESRKRPGTRIGENDLISVGCGTMIAWFPKPGVARSSRAGGARDFNANPTPYKFVAWKDVPGEQVYRWMITTSEADTLFWISTDTWICRSPAMRSFIAGSAPAERLLSFS